MAALANVGGALGAGSGRHADLISGRAAPVWPILSILVQFLLSSKARAKPLRRKGGSDIKRRRYKVSQFWRTIGMP